MLYEKGYQIFNFLAYWAMLAVNLLLWKKSAKPISGPMRLVRRLCPKDEKKAELFTTLLGIAETGGLTAIWFLSGTYLGNWAGTTFGGSRNYVGNAVLSPFVFFLACLLLKEEPFWHLDLYSPGCAFALAFFKFACYCNGCCGGIHVRFMFPYPGRYLRQFPVQLLEMLLALILFILLLAFRKKLRPGTVQPLYLIFYSVTRFFSEFLRWEDKVYGSFRLYQVMLFFSALIGLAEYLIMRKYGAKLVQWTKDWCSRPYWKSIRE